MPTAEAWNAISMLAESQWGLVTTAQAARLGVGPVMVNRLAARGFLEHEAFGVYRVRGAVSTLATPRQAAWLQLQPALLLEERWAQLPDGPVVSHSAAARAQNLGDVLGEVHEFTAPVRRRSRRGDVRFYRAQLHRDEIRMLDGLPVTTAWRTVVDLVHTGVDGSHIAGVLRDAAAQGLLHIEDLRAADAAELDSVAARWGMDNGAELLDHLVGLSGVVSPLPAATAPTDR